MHSSFFKIQHYRILKNKHSNHQILCSIFLIMAIISGLAVYHGDTTLAGISIRKLLRLILYILVFGAWILIWDIRRLPHKSLAFFIPIVYWMVCHFNAYVFGPLEVLLTMELAAFFMLDSTSMHDVFKYYRKYLIIMACIGIICYAAYSLSFPLPHRIVPYYSDSNSSQFYIDYKLCYLYLKRPSLRLCGLFNEPGYFGTMLALSLCADRMNLKHKGNWILLMAGVLTFSVAFFLILLFYMILLSYRHPKIMFFLIILSIFYFLVLPRLHFSNANINELVLRLTWENNRLYGDNRTTSEFDSTFSSWLQSNQIFFGYGNGYINSQQINGVSSYKVILIEHGLICFLLIYTGLLICALKKSNGNLYAIYFIAAFFLSIYQRPKIYTVAYFTILFGGIENAKTLFYNNNITRHLVVKWKARH